MKDIDKLREIAIKTGRETVFTADEAMEALHELLHMGLTTDQIISNLENYSSVFELRASIRLMHKAINWGKHLT